MGTSSNLRHWSVWGVVPALLVCVVLGSVWYRRHQAGQGNYVSNDYKVQFEWTDGRVSNVRFTDVRTGAEENSPQLRAVLSSLASQEIRQIVTPTQLKNAQGSAYIFIQGQGEPYLARWSDWQIPKLSDWMEAAKSWKLSELQRLLAEGVPANAHEIGDGRTALIWAAVDPRSGTLYRLARERRAPEPNPQTVEFLLQAGADANAKDSNGVTALMRAGALTASSLIAGGADVNASDNDGLTPLMYAARNADVQTIKLELAAHAAVNTRDKNGWTVLMHAAAHGSPEALRLLLAAGADRSVRSNSGETALEIAQHRATQDPGFREAAQLLSASGPN